MHVMSRELYDGLKILNRETCILRDKQKKEEKIILVKQIF